MLTQLSRQKKNTRLVEYPWTRDWDPFGDISNPTQAPKAKSFHMKSLEKHHLAPNKLFQCAAAWGRVGRGVCRCHLEPQHHPQAGVQRPHGPGGMQGAMAFEREAEVVLQTWEWWFSKFDLLLQHHAAPHMAPCTGHPKSPALLLLDPSPSSRFCYLMDQDKLKALLFAFCVRQFRAISINFCRLILTPATFNI